MQHFNEVIRRLDNLLSQIGLKFYLRARTNQIINLTDMPNCLYFKYYEIQIKQVESFTQFFYYYRCLAYRKSFCGVSTFKFKWNGKQSFKVDY